MSENDGVEPNRFAPEPVTGQIGDIPDREYAPFFFSEDKPRLTIEMTNDELQAVIASLRNGAYMTYGDDGSAVFWAFLKNVQYPIEGGDMSCDDVQECIENEQGVQDAIAGILEYNEDFQSFLNHWIETHPNGTLNPKNHPVDPGTLLTINQFGECDLDLLYGQCVALVETANTMIVDFLEKWELYTNKGEVVSDMVNAVPLLSELAQASGIAGVLEYANDLVDSIAENYNGDYDLEYRIALSCELFCAAQNNNCTVTTQMFADIMNARIGNALSLSNLAELMISLTDQDITGFNVADLYMAFFADAIAVGNLIIPTTWGLETWLAVMFASNTPDDDWMSECEECPPPPQDCYDFTIDEQDWVATSNAEYTTNTGWAAITSGQWLIQNGNHTQTSHSIKITFNNNFFDGSDDFHKFFVVLSSYGGGNSQGFGTGIDPLLTAPLGYIVLTSTGDDWIGLNVQIAAGGYTWPVGTFITEICINPE